jgi:hypothetical protein
MTNRRIKNSNELDVASNLKNQSAIWQGLVWIKPRDAGEYNPNGACGQPRKHVILMYGAKNRKNQRR